MAITLKNYRLQDLYTMVRKGGFQFEAKDRIAFEVPKRGTFYIGGITRDELTGSLLFYLYDKNGRYIPGTVNTRSMNNLSDMTVFRLVEVTCDYFERSLLRKANLINIVDILKDFPVPGDLYEFEFNFADSFKPFVISEEHMSDNVVAINQIYSNTSEPDSFLKNLKYEGCNDNGNKITGYLCTLNDTSIANISSVLNQIRRNYIQKVNADMKEPVLKTGKMTL